MRIKDLAILLILVFALSSCTVKEKDIDIDLTLNDYVITSSSNEFTFAFNEQLSINDSFNISYMEIRTSEFEEFPYETVMLKEQDYNQYMSFLSEYLTQLAKLELDDTNSVTTGHKEKLKIVLTNGYSEVEFKFYENADGEIRSSELTYINNNNIHFRHIFTEIDDITYLSLK